MSSVAGENVEPAHDPLRLPQVRRQALPKDALRAAQVVLPMPGGPLYPGEEVVPFALQIGAFDGVTDDCLYPLLQSQPALCAWRFEPEPEAFAKLVILHGRDKRVRCIRQAVTPDRSGTCSLWRFREELVLAPRPEWSYQAASLEPQATEMRDYPQALEQITVPCISIREVCRRSPPIDGLFLDAEGLDYALLQAFPWDQHHPAAVICEHKHMSDREYARTRLLLEGQGYDLLTLERDLVATLEKR
jgi:hypothetical protein